MKIEKITENKIRIILKQEDFKDKTLNFRKLLLTTPESQSLFLEILNKAKEEVNFDTDGHKLLIEAFFENEDVFVFIITKYIDSNNTCKPKKYLTVKRKYQVPNCSCYIYQFNKFENFCDYCNFINNSIDINIKKVFKSSILYFYNDTYYLVIDNNNSSNSFMNIIHSYLSEFSDSYILNSDFKYKLQEHGKIIMKNNAILTGIKYFFK